MRHNAAVIILVIGLITGLVLFSFAPSFTYKSDEGCSSSSSVTIHGENFDLNSRIVITGGGPYLAGNHDTPGNAYSIAISGNYAYVADSSSGLQIIDISSPSSPVGVGNYDTPGNAYDVAVSGGYAYVADYSAGLQIIDISSPSSPVGVGNYDTPGNAYGVAISGNYAYVADGDLQIIDISTPSNPIFVGKCDTPGSGAHYVAVSGDYAYVTEDSSGLQIIDISTPSNPIQIGSYDTPSRARGVSISGNYAYVADWDYDLHIIDISNPSNPVGVGSCYGIGMAQNVSVSGNYAYVATFGADLQIIDISTPSNPFLVEAYYTPTYTRDVAVLGNYAYVADEYAGLQIIDIRQSSNPVWTGYGTPAAAFGVAVSGDYAYMVDGDLQIIDISTPFNPIFVRGCVTPDGASDVAVSGNYAYIAGGSFQIVDISNPSNPVFVGKCDTPGYAYDVAVSGGYAYVADHYRGDLQIIDIRTPSNPVLIGSFDTITSAYGVAVSGNYAYVADQDRAGGLQIIDISDPSDPVQVGMYVTPDAALGVVISGNYAYVADRFSGLQIIDISNPYSPVGVGSCDTTGSANSVAVSGDFAYIAGPGLQIIDISTLSNPVLIGSYSTPCSALDVVVSENYVYVADQSYSSVGLHIFNLVHEAESVTFIDSQTIEFQTPDGLREGSYNVTVVNSDGSTQTIHNAYEVVCSSIGEIEIIDPNPDLISEECVVCIDPLLIDDYEKLAQANVVRVGAVADGVTQLLLRVESESDVTFSILDISLDDGSFARIDGYDWSLSLTVSPHTIDDGINKGRSFAFARYRTPSNFTATLTNRYRPIFFIASNAEGSASKLLNLQRPPVVLVHGLWSSSDTWSEGLNWEKRLINEGFDPVLIDYCKPNKDDECEGSASHFDPTIHITENIPIQVLKDKIDETKNIYRDKYIAITQVDVLAHSMGGLVTRAYTMVEGNNYFKNDNFRRGDIHRLITIGTPHTGSEMANLLLNEICLQREFNKKGLYCNLGAVNDLKVGGNALKLLNSVSDMPFLIHTVVGIASDTQKFMNQKLLFIRFNLICGSVFPGFDGVFGEGINNDLIVSEASQSAEGCSFPHIKEDPIQEPLVHSEALPYGTFELESIEVFDKVIELLN